MNETISPTNSESLEQSEQSIREMLDTLIVKKFTLYICSSVIFAILIILEYVKWLQDNPPPHIYVTMFAIIATSFAANQALKLRSKIEDLRKMLKTEKSIQQTIDQLVDEKYMFYIYSAVVFAILIILEYVKWLQDNPPPPIFVTMFAVIVTSFTANKALKLRSKIEELKKVRDEQSS